MARVIAEETQQLETDLNEERSRYQNLLTEHLRLEEKYDDLKEDMASSVRDTCSVANFTTVSASLQWGDGEHLWLLPPMFVEHLQAWTQEDRLHPQQQRIRVHLQLRVRRIGRRFPRSRSENMCTNDS